MKQSKQQDRHYIIHQLNTLPFMSASAAFVSAVVIILSYFASSDPRQRAFAVWSVSCFICFWLFRFLCFFLPFGLFPVFCFNNIGALSALFVNTTDSLLALAFFANVRLASITPKTINLKHFIVLKDLGRFWVVFTIKIAMIGIFGKIMIHAHFAQLKWTILTKPGPFPMQFLFWSISQPTSARFADGFQVFVAGYCLKFRWSSLRLWPLPHPSSIWHNWLCYKAVQQIG